MAKIIIVEDDAVIRTHMAEALRVHGHQVVDCDGSADPAAFCSKEAADLLVMDIGLSHKNGLYWCEQIRRRSQVPI